MAGDFNCYHSLKLDSLVSKFTSGGVSSSNELEIIARNFHIEDRWRIDNPTKQYFTWCNRAGTQGSKIDRFCVPTTVKARIDHSHFDQCDHHIVACNVQIEWVNAAQTGKSF